MSRGFIFDHGRCVNCKACSAACILYNEWTVSPRNILTYNAEADALLPLINLSLACNHCEYAACMDGCPSSAISRDLLTGAVIIDRQKCIGCKYCQWNCPYDAPKFDSVDKTIAKCHLCNASLAKGGSPACATACPTGALSFGQMSEPVPDIPFTWFPEKELKPSIEFTSRISNPLQIIPAVARKESLAEQSQKNITNETSLIVFSFLSVLSVATLITALINGTFPEKSIFIPILLLAGLISLFHLGKKARSWRAIANLKYSPLSREIAGFIVYSVLSLITVVYEIPVLMIVSSVAGLLFLILIDSVYIFSDKNRSVLVHSGQTFISALLIISFLSGSVTPFIFLTLVKLGSSVYSLFSRKYSNYFIIRFLRTAFLVLPAIAMVTNNSYYEILIVFVFITGELFDRILFYLDFNPLNITRLIREH